MAFRRTQNHQIPKKTGIIRQLAEIKGRNGNGGGNSFRFAVMLIVVIAERESLFFCRCDKLLLFIVHTCMSYSSVDEGEGTDSDTDHVWLLLSILGSLSLQSINWFAEFGIHPLVFVLTAMCNVDTLLLSLLLLMLCVVFPRTSSVQMILAFLWETWGDARYARLYIFIYIYVIAMFKLTV